MSKKKKHESKKQRKNRIIGHSRMIPEKYRKKEEPFKMPRTFEEAVAMGILK